MSERLKEYEEYWNQGYFKFIPDLIEYARSLELELDGIANTGDLVADEYEKAYEENQMYRHVLEDIAYSQFNVDPKRVVVKLQSKARQALSR